MMHREPCLIADPDGVPVAALPAGRLEVTQEGDAARWEHGRAQLLARARLGPQEPAYDANSLQCAVTGRTLPVPMGQTLCTWKMPAT